MKCLQVKLDYIITSNSLTGFLLVNLAFGYQTKMVSLMMEDLALAVANQILLLVSSETR